jgi:predicted O-methyltransferase YrrM
MKPRTHPFSEDDAVRLALMVQGDTMMTKRELQHIYRMASGVHGPWIELGSWCGRSFMAAALALPENGSIVAVDLFEGAFSDHGDRYTDLAPTSSWVWDHFQATRNAVAELRPDLEIQVLRMRTNEAAQHIADASVGGVFIDADHSYEAVKSDIENYWTKLKTGGILAGHDYWEHDPGVIQAVDERFGEQATKIRKTRIWYAIKDNA